MRRAKTRRAECGMGNQISCKVAACVIVSSFFCRSSWATSWMLRVTSDQYLPLHLRPVSADRWRHVRIFEHRIYRFTEILCLKTSASTDEVCLQCLDVNLPWGQRDAQLGKKPNFAPSRRTVKSLILESYIEIYCIYLYYLYYLYCIQYIHAYQSILYSRYSNQNILSS